MKQCPLCRAELPDGAVSCPKCGGSYRPDGSFESAWDAEMARLATERERKVARAEAFGRWGRPHTRFFLEDKAGCLVSLLALTLTIVALAAALVLVAR